MSISAIIVTYNRKTDLLRCIKYVLNQTVKPDNLILVNNASTDNTLQDTFDFFDYNSENFQNTEELQFICEINKSNVYIINKTVNTGGAGGFYTGLKTAHEMLNTDFYWMMDDDGYPETHCLEQLISMSDKYDYIMPTSIDINDHTKLSWPTRKKNGKKTGFYNDLKQSWGQIMNYVTPFNGILLSRKCVEEAGYINKDFFIWGDDYEHYYRCKQKGFTPVTFIDSIFYHPAQKVQMVKIFFGLIPIAYSDSKIRMVCLARNWTYIYKHYSRPYMIPVKYLMYLWLFIFTRHGDFDGWRLYRQSVKDGLKEDFTGHLKYL